MTNVTIFGSGNMGAAIDSVLSAGGASVDHITSSDYWKSVTGELVILAVYYPALEEILSRYADDLAGKIVVDITNPVDPETDGLAVPAGSSSAEELAAKLPSSRVLKAFNTNFAATLASKSVGPNKTTILVAGDDGAAKTTLIDALVAGGVDAVDAGSLKRARELEGLGFLQISLAATDKIGWTGGFALVK
jgi:8-hydroxy-5-deazaflavin:NADPH oxidoreductase